MHAKNKYNAGLYADLNCIWMASDLIEFQLCDKNYDCENCQLDIIMRNLTNGNHNSIKRNYMLSETGFIDKIVSGIKNINYQFNLLYLKNNLVLKNLYANIFYIGINPAVFPLMDNITDIKEYMKRVYFTRGQKLLVIEGDWGKVSLTVPLNFLLLDKLNWTPDEIQSKKWIALIVVNQNEITDAKISAEQWKVEKSKLTNMLDEYRECCLKIKSDNAEEGTKLNFFYELIGNAEYQKLLEHLFNE